MSLSTQSYLDLRPQLLSGEISPSQLTQDFLAQIEARKSLNAFLEVFEKEALTRCTELETKRISGEPLGRLFGMVIGIKDVICYQGHKVSAASKMLENFESLITATAVQRLLNEDAIIIGRLNCDEFAMGSTNEHSYYGATKNAADESLVPGGSSGASAVAVQAYLCHAALGSDTGGSVRQPASFCGVLGFKPTYGRISRHGLIAYASSFDQIGILAQSVQETALLTEIMAGSDAYDATCSTSTVPNYPKDLAVDRKFRIALPTNAIHNEGLDGEIRDSILSFTEQLKQQGHVVDMVDLPAMDSLVPAYYIMTCAEASSNLSRYDGVHYGYRTDNPSDLNELYTQSRSEGFGTEVKRRIMLGTFVLSAGYYDAYYKKAQQLRRLIADQTNKLFQDYDLILSPTTPSTAFKIGAYADQEPTQMYLADIYTVQANLCGLPAISVPLFEHSNGSPFGIQAMASQWNEQALFDFAALSSH